jgi:hypothetical protein
MLCTSSSSLVGCPRPNTSGARPGGHTICVMKMREAAPYCGVQRSAVWLTPDSAVLDGRAELRRCSVNDVVEAACSIRKVPATLRTDYGIIRRHMICSSCTASSASMPRARLYGDPDSTRIDIRLRCFIEYVPLR